MKLFRRLKQHFAQQCYLFGPDCDLAGLGFAQRAASPHDIAQLQQFQKRPLIGEQLSAQSQLDGPAGIPQGDKNQFANVTKKNDTARTAGPLALGVVDVAGLNIFGKTNPLKTTAIRVDLKRFHFLQFLTPLLFKFIRDTRCLIRQSNSFPDLLHIIFNGLCR